MGYFREKKLFGNKNWIPPELHSSVLNFRNANSCWCGMMIENFTRFQKWICITVYFRILWEMPSALKKAMCQRKSFVFWILMTFNILIKHMVFLKVDGIPQNRRWYSKNQKNVVCRQEQLKVSQRFVFLLFVLFMSKIWFKTRFLMWWIGKVVCCWFSEMLNLSSSLGFNCLRNNVCLALKHSKESLFEVLFLSAT